MTSPATAVVTGASRGIGLAIATQPVRDGFRVCIPGRTDATLEEAVESLGNPDHAMYGAGRAHREHQVSTVTAMVEQFGSLDVLVNKAGIDPTHGPGREDEVARAYPLGRPGVPADGAGVVAFLAGMSSAWITGQTVVIDGGVLLGGRL